MIFQLVSGLAFGCFSERFPLPGDGGWLIAFKLVACFLHKEMQDLEAIVRSLMEDQGREVNGEVPRTEELFRLDQRTALHVGWCTLDV